MFWKKKQKSDDAKKTEAKSPKLKPQTPVSQEERPNDEELNEIFEEYLVCFLYLQ